MQIKEIHYYCDETLQPVGAKFFIGDEEVSFEDYVDFVNGLGNDDEEVEIAECYDCECCKECDYEEEEITYDELLDVFTLKIQETLGCPGCIKELLDEICDIVREE